MAALTTNLVFTGKSWCNFLCPVALIEKIYTEPNSLPATGVVALPGMMTGQILSRVAPVEAIKYQILIMFLIAGGTGIGVVSAVQMATSRLTDARHRLRLDRIASA